MKYLHICIARRYEIGILITGSIAIFAGLIFPSIFGLEHATARIAMVLMVILTSGTTGVYLCFDLSIKQQDARLLTSEQSLESIVVEMKQSQEQLA